MVQHKAGHECTMDEGEKKILYKLKSEKCGRPFSPLPLHECIVELCYVQQQVTRLKFMLNMSNSLRMNCLYP